MNTTWKTILLIWVMSSHGCAWLDRMDESRRFELANLDDRACRSAGYEWPGEAYLECRRLRADARQREQWQELQMSRQHQRTEPGIPPLTPAEPYRPIREDDFRCLEATSRSGETYIACRESGR